MTFERHQLLVEVAENIMKLLPMQWMYTAEFGYSEQVYFYVDRFIDQLCEFLPERLIWTKTDMLICHSAK